MGEYTPITLQRGINDVTYMDNNGRITNVDWKIPIYFLRGNNDYQNIGTIDDIRRRGTFNNYVTDANSINIGTLDELRTGRLFIRISEEKRTPSKLRGGKTRRRKPRKSSNKNRKQRKTKRRRQ